MAMGIEQHFWNKTTLLDEPHQLVFFCIKVTTGVDNGTIVKPVIQ
jgi:hypothetical protein